MSDAPKRIFMAPNGGLPTGNYPKHLLVEYVRADIFDAIMRELERIGMNPCAMTAEKSSDIRELVAKIKSSTK